MLINKKGRPGFKLVLAFALILVLSLNICALSATATVIGPGLDPSQGANIIRQELNQNRSEIKRELEGKGYEVSEENLNRYIDEVTTAYNSGLTYIQNNPDRLIAEMQKAVQSGESQAELDRINERIIQQMMKESGFDPEAIAARIFPKKSTSQPQPVPDPAPQPSQETTPQTTPQPSQDTTKDPAADSTETPSAPGSNIENQLEDMADQVGSFISQAEPRNIFNSFSNSIRSWAYEKQRAGERRKELIDIGEDGEMAGDIIKDSIIGLANLTSRATKIAASVFVSTVDGYYDFIDNVANGDGVALGFTKSAISNTINGFSGIVVGSADLVSHYFSRLPFVRNRYPDLHKTMDIGDAVKGPVNYFMDSFAHGYRVTEQRLEMGEYGELMRKGHEAEKNKPAAAPKAREIDTHGQQFQKPVDLGAGREAWY